MLFGTLPIEDPVTSCSDFCWIPANRLFRQLGMGHREWLLFLLGRHGITLGQGGDNLQVNGASPFVLDNDKATETARASAVKNAKAKAASYAKLLGVKLGKVIYLDEPSTPTPYPVYGMTAKADDAATQIDLGEQKVTVSVTVRWSIG